MRIINTRVFCFAWAVVPPRPVPAGPPRREAGSHQHHLFDFAHSTASQIILKRTLKWSQSVRSGHNVRSRLLPGSLPVCRLRGRVLTRRRPAASLRNPPGRAATATPATAAAPCGCRPAPSPCLGATSHTERPFPRPVCPDRLVAECAKPELPEPKGETIRMNRRQHPDNSKFLSLYLREFDRISSAALTGDQARALLDRIAESEVYVLHEAQFQQSALPCLPRFLPISADEVVNPRSPSISRSSAG